MENCKGFKGREKRKMSVLILSCDTGEGHNSCAKAIKEIYDAKGVPCEIINPLQLISERFSRIVHRTHTFIYQKHAKIFEMGYEYAEKTKKFRVREGTLLYRFFERGADRLYVYMTEHQITDVICVHPLLMMMVSVLKKKYPVTGSVAFVATDYTCSPGVKQGKPDVCFIPDQSLIHDFCCEAIPQSDIVSSGIPVRQTFYTHHEKNAAKSRFGIPQDAPHLVVMCGSMGCDTMRKVIGYLPKDEFYITVVCGTNKKMQSQLEETYAAYEKIQIYGYVNDMSLLMDSADVFVTKPGGLSSTEIAVKRLPAVYMNTVGGCESYNLQFFAKKGCALAAMTPKQAAELCCELMRDPKRRETMHCALRELQLSNAAEIVYDTIQGNRQEVERERDESLCI